MQYFFSRRWQKVIVQSLLLPGLLLHLCFTGTCQAPPKQGHFMANGRAVNIASFDREIIHMMQEIGVPGMSLAIIDNNQVVYCNGYGVRKKEEPYKVTKRTVFDGCSLSKTLLAYVAYQLADEAKIQLDTPLYRYLPYPRLEHDRRYKLITARMVLSHSSGLENWSDYNNSDTLEILAAPGTKFLYSGEGYQYLAKVVEQLLGQQYGEYIQERVLTPLQLKNTYLKYKKPALPLFHRIKPWNFAVGHQTDGRQPLFQNSGTFPAAGNHFTAEDYAKLITAIFDTSRISYNRRADILAPIVQIEHSAIFYGPGFEVLPDPDNLIISHGGDKPGYKNLVFYSVQKRSGFVMMVNSDRGKSMAEKICQLSVQLNIDPFLKSQYYFFEQYPSPALSLLKIYDDHGRDTMFAAIARFHRQQKLNVNSLSTLSYFFRFGGDRVIAKDLLEYNTRLYPESALAYSLLGELYVSMDRYEEGYRCLKKAKALKFDLWDLEEEDMAEHNKRLADAEARKSNQHALQPNNETIIQAEEYMGMRGVRVQATTDTGGGDNVAFIDTEDYMDYRVNIPAAGTYAVTVRVASEMGGSQMELRADNILLGKINIPTTNGWQNWISVSTQVQLPQGLHPLRIYVSNGGFNFNWMKFVPVPHTAQAN
jgi:CubicO group peptidase (beta-lactamase class C family)